MSSSAEQVVNDGLFRRVFKNSAMLTAGKVYTALVGLLYLALATRALGMHDFGVLILIHAYTVAVRDFVTLKTSQCVVRYGAICLETNEKEDFQKLVKFTMLLDIGFCVAGTLVGILAISYVGPSFGVTPELIPVASVYCIMILFNFKATPLGLLRLFDRFDLIAVTLMVVPTIRLVGACAAYVFYQDVSAFLFFWFIAGAVQCFGIVYFGWREFRRRGFSTGYEPRIQAPDPAPSRHPAIHLDFPCPSNPVCFNRTHRDPYCRLPDGTGGRRTFQDCPGSLVRAAQTRTAI